MSTKKLLAVLLLLATLMSCFAAFAEDWVAVVTKKSTVYKSASTSSKVLGTLNKNQMLVLKDAKSGWAKVTLNGATGYMALDNLKKSSVNAYVSAAQAYVYSSKRTNSKLICKIPFGEKVKVEAISGDWARLVNGSAVGYCKCSSLTPNNPNKYNMTVYTQENSVKVYSAPTTSASVLGTAAINTKYTFVAATGDNKWCRIKSGSHVGFIETSKLDTKKVNIYSTAKAASGKAVTADWFKSNISSIFAKGDTAVVTDVSTGISFKVYRGGGTNHADVQPYTAADTAALKKACGADFGTWARRAIWVSIDGDKYAASMNCMPHGDGSITTNKYDGHFCIHFTNSKTHGGNATCPLHQAAIKRALAAG